MEQPLSLQAISLWAAKNPSLNAVLDAPVAQTFDRLARLVQNRSTLQHLVKGHRCRTLREALTHPSADVCMNEELTGARRSAFVSVIASWLRTQAQLSEGDAPGMSMEVVAPVVGVPPPPLDVAGLRVWATRHGVLERLDDPATVLQSRVYTEAQPLLFGDGSGTSRVADVLKPPPSSRASRGYGIRAYYDVVGVAARNYLLEVARARSAQMEARRALEARAQVPTEPALHALFARLQAARAELARTATARPLGTFVPVAMELADAPLRFAYREATEPRYGAQLVNVEITIDGEAGDPMSVRCSCAPGPASVCAHALSAIDAAIDVLRDPMHPVRPRVAEVLRTPGWSRFLRAFEEGLARTAGPEPTQDARLAFRIDLSQDAPRVDTVVQKQLKRGGWSVGQSIKLDDLQRRRELTRDPRDARAIDAMSLGLEEAGSVRPSRRRSFRALEALIRHPRAFLHARPDKPVRIERARVRLVFDASDAGLTITPVVGEQRFSAAALMAAAGGTENVIVVDEATPALLLCTLEAPALALLLALARYPARFPPESYEALLSQLMPLQESIEIELPDALQGESIDADRRIVVRLSPRAEGPDTDVAILVRPIAGGPLFPPGEGATVVLHAIAGRRVAARRALADEVVAATNVVKSLPLEPAEEDTRGGKRAWSFSLPREENVLDLLSALRALGDRVVVEWPEDERKIELMNPALKRALKIRITQKRDWFGVEGEVVVDGEEVSFAALLDAVRRGRRYVEVGRHRFAAIEDELRARIATAGDLLFQGRHGLEVGLPAAAALAELVDDPAQLVAVQRWRNLVRRVDAARALEPVVPKELRAELRPYQVEGYQWLSRLAAWGVGGCLADDMGLGKTVQTLALLIERASLGPTLVIAPTSVGPNWLSEAARFAPSLRARLYRGLDRAAVLREAGPGDVLVTSYGLATRDAEQLTAVRFSTLVLDEAQAIKNALTRRARAVRDLDADFRVALTGTPVENHLGELWSLMRIVAPGLFGSWDQFRERYAAPIERDRDPERSAALARALRPFLLRRAKADVAPELPPRTEIARFVDLSPGERRLYDDARRVALAAIASGEGDARFILLAALTRLRRLACHPRLLDDASTVPSSKLATLLEIVAELRETGHRALVFSQFTTHLALVREALSREKITYEYLDGSTPSEERTRRIASFQAGRADLFLISLKAGGTGLNLTAADYVIHLDPWWNPAVEDQATDRAHRIGQANAVTVIRLIMRGTIEETVLAMHGEKRALSASVFDEQGGPSRLSPQDLADLIRAGADEAAGGESAEDEAGDTLGGEVLAEDAAAPTSRAPARARAAAVATPTPSPTSAPPSDASGRAPPGALPTDAPKIEAIMEAVLDDLAAQKGVADRRYDSTLRTYERALRRFAAYVGENAAEGADLRALIDGYVDALRAGRWPAPKSEPPIAQVVMNHVRAFLDRSG